MNLLTFAALAALASQAICSPIETDHVDIPEYDIRRRHDPSHHNEIGIPGDLLIRHIQETYPNRNIVREVRKIPGLDDVTATGYDIPDDLMDLAVRSFPLHKRKANVLEHRASKRNILPGPVTGGENLEKRHSIDVILPTHECITGEEMTKDNFEYIMVSLCAQWAGYDRSGSEPPNYQIIGPYVLDADRTGTILFSWHRGNNLSMDRRLCLQLRELLGCRSSDRTAGGNVGGISKIGEGSYHFGIRVQKANTQESPLSTG